MHLQRVEQVVQGRENKIKGRQINKVARYGSAQ